jgi:hypothetical protein
MSPVSLDCPFLIASSVFSNVHLPECLIKDVQLEICIYALFLHEVIVNFDNFNNKKWIDFCHFPLPGASKMYMDRS